MTPIPPPDKLAAMFDALSRAASTPASHINSTPPSNNSTTTSTGGPMPTSTPNWGNEHAPDCPVAVNRPIVWANLCKGLNDSHHERDANWGVVIEYTANGDEDYELCECHVHHHKRNPPNPPSRMTMGDLDNLMDLLHKFDTTLSLCDIPEDHPFRKHVEFAYAAAKAIRALTPADIEENES